MREQFANRSATAAADLRRGGTAQAARSVGSDSYCRAGIYRPQSTRRFSDCGVGSLHRLVTLFSHLGDARALPRSARRSGSRSRGTGSVRQRAGVAGRNRQKEVVHSPCRLRSLSGEQRRRRYRSLRDVSRAKELTRFHTLRQQKKSSGGKPQLALGDFVAPRAEGLIDYIGAFAVTTGHGTQELAERFERENDQYNSIMAKALADRLAEAFAEYLHKRVRDGVGVRQRGAFDPMRI